MDYPGGGAERRDGGPAFPRVGEGVGNPQYDAPGMSLRDWFAGQALTGILTTLRAGDVETVGEFTNRAAKLACAAADAMLAAREEA